MKPDIRINASACVLGALALLLIPLRWLAAALMAAMIHEMGHLLALKLLGIQVIGISVGFGGACIETVPMSGREEVVSALAGPIAGLLLLPLARWIPCTALCAAVQSAYNLLPLGQQDGGRVLRRVLERFTPKAQRICDAAEMLLIGAAMILGTMAALYLRLGVLPVLLASGLWAKSIVRKIPCKSAL